MGGSRGGEKLTQRLIAAARALGATAVRRVAPREVVTAEWVRRKCQYGCDMYGQCLTCPPYSPPPEATRRLLDGYRMGLLIQVTESRSRDLRRIIAELERTAFLAGAYQAFGMPSGPCRLCRGDCPAAQSGATAACLHPEGARPSMEACGIDVFATVRAQGLPLEVVQSPADAPHYYGLLLIE